MVGQWLSVLPSLSADCLRVLAATVKWQAGTDKEQTRQK
jgi:hypothetical protein